MSQLFRSSEDGYFSVNISKSDCGPVLEQFWAIAMGFADEIPEIAMSWKYIPYSTFNPGIGGGIK